MEHKLNDEHAAFRGDDNIFILKKLIEKKN